MINQKRAEGGMTIGTIVVIILAILVLVVLAFGFTEGWGEFWSKITGLGGGKVNAQTVVQKCQIECASQSTYNYCRKLKSVVFVDNGDKYKLTCSKLEEGGNRILDVVDSTGASKRINIPGVGLEYCDTINRAQCEVFTNEAMSSKDAMDTNSRIKANNLPLQPPVLPVEDSTANSVD